MDKYKAIYESTNTYNVITDRHILQPTLKVLQPIHPVTKASNVCEVVARQIMRLNACEGCPKTVLRSGDLS